MKSSHIPKTWTDWARESLSLTADGGLLTIPLEGLVFKVNHQRKILTVLCEENSQMATHEKVFAAVGYKIIYGNSPYDDFLKFLESIPRESISSCVVDLDQIMAGIKKRMARLN